MSLLLDALKKAAEEKKKTADTAENSAVEHDAVKSEREFAENRYKKDEQSKDEQSNQVDDFDLSLDDEALQDVEQQSESIASYQEKYQEKNQVDSLSEVTTGKEEDYDRLSEIVSTNADQNIDNNIQPDQVVRSPDRAGGNLDYDMSDEALDLLIHKTNRSYKNNKIIWVVLVSILSLTVLVVGGLYFTEDMQSEVAFLETRHNQSMRLVRERTSKESLPDKSVIIENLVGDEDLAKKVEFTKIALAKENNQKILDAKKKSAKQKQSAEKTNAPVTSAEKYTKNAVLSIEKTQQADPVSLLLDEAWLAYEAGEFERSDKAYEKVLGMEKNNRDALLGRGAIALGNKSFGQAKKFYLALLEINPRDPDAISALTNLAQSNNTALNKLGKNQAGQSEIENEQATKSEKYLKSLLQENEQSAVLNFSLGSVYARQSRWKLAQEHFFKAWANDNNNPGYAYNLAVSLDQMGKAKEAKQFYQESLRLSENKKVSFSKQSVLDRIVQIN